MRLRHLVAAAGAAALLAGAASTAHGASAYCSVTASGGFVNCLNFVTPQWEQAKAPAAAATPYRFALHRFSDGARWGPWTWYDLGYHTVFLSLAGTIMAQIDNQGIGTQTYYVAMGT